MSQPTYDPYAAASQQGLPPGLNTVPPVAPAPQSYTPLFTYRAASNIRPAVADTSGNLTASFAGEQSQLFGTPVLPPSLLNKSHPLGTERSGVIAKAPYDVQARDFNTKKAKFWPAGGGKPTFDAVDALTGERNRPVKDTVIELTTAYRFTPQECALVGRDPNSLDSGARAVYVSGDDLKQLRGEIARLGLRSEQEMIGLTLTVTRVGQRPNATGNPSWINKVTLTR